MECGGGRMNEVQKFKDDMNKLSVQEVKNILNNFIKNGADEDFINACKQVINQKRSLKTYKVADNNEKE